MPGEMEFLTPKAVNWTVEDIQRLEMRGEVGEALRRWRILLAPFLDPNIAAQVRSMPSHRYIWLHIGQCSRRLGFFDDSLEAYEAARDLASEFRDTRTLAQATNGLGAVLRSRGDFTPAIQQLRTALEAAESLDDPSLVATIRDNIAMSLRAQGLLEDALQEEQRARAVVTSSSRRVDNAVQARVLSNLGVLYMESGRRQEAVPILEEALVRAHAAGDSPQEAAIRSNLAAT
jgi:tetratricopeptide (TPR) repeat protein